MSRAVLSLQERFCLVCASEVVFLLRAQAALIIEAIMSIYDSSFTNTSSAVSLSKAHVREPEKVRGKTMAARGRSMREGLAACSAFLSLHLFLHLKQQTGQADQTGYLAGGRDRENASPGWRRTNSEGGRKQESCAEGSQFVASALYKLTGSLELRRLACLPRFGEECLAPLCLGKR